MPIPRKIAYQTEVDKAKFMSKSNQKKIVTIGPFVEDTFETAAGIDSGLSSNWTFDSVEKVIRPDGGMGIIVSIQIEFLANVLNSVTGIWESEGTTRIFFSRDNGVTWTQLTNNTLTNLTGPAGKLVKLKAELDPGSVLKGWSAHW